MCIRDSFIANLPTTERKVFLCRYWYLDSIEQISADFCFSNSKVKSMLHRTRAVSYTHLVGGGAGWYFKIYRPKKQRAAESEADYGGEYDGAEDYDETDPEDDGPPWDEDGEE